MNSSMERIEWPMVHICIDDLFLPETVVSSNKRGTVFVFVHVRDWMCL